MPKKLKPRKDVRSKVVTFKTTKQEHKNLEKSAREKGFHSVSELIRLCCKEYMGEECS